MPKKDIEVRMCFQKDDDGHTYLVPANKKKRFQQLLEAISQSDTAPEWEDWYKEFSDSACYSADSYTFLDPKTDIK